MNLFDFQEALRRGIIDEENLHDELEMSRKKDILAKHPYEIWQNESNGRWYTHLPDDTKKEHRRLIAKSKREDLEKTVIDFYKKAETIPTVNLMFTSWLEKKRSVIKSQTAMKYENVFHKYIEPTWFGKSDIRKISMKDLDLFCKETIGKNKMKSKCWASIRTDLRGIIRYAKLEGLTSLSIESLGDLDIAKNAFKKEMILPGQDVLTTAEKKLIYDYIDEHEDDIEFLGIKLLFKTGLRIGELSALKYSDFDFDRGVLIVTRTEEKIQNPDWVHPSEKSAKTGENFDGPKIPKTIVTVAEATKGALGWREVILDDSTLELVEKIHALNPDGCFLFEKNGHRIHANCWTKRLPRLCRHLGIGTPSERCDDLVVKKNTHKGRKHYISSLLHAKVEPKFIQSQVGHMDIQTTLSYYDRDIEDFETRRNALTPVLAEL